MVRKKDCFKTRLLNTIACIVGSIVLFCLGCLDSEWPGFIIIAFAGSAYLFFFSYVNDWWEE